MGKILIICPTHRDLREIEHLGLKRSHEFFTHHYASLELEAMAVQHLSNQLIAGIETEINTILDCYSGDQIDGVFSADDYPGSIIASIVAKTWDLPGPTPRANLLFQHKYHARRLQESVVPRATPRFALHDGTAFECEIGLPAFVKPVKSFFSVGAYPVTTNEEFQKACESATLPAAFFAPLRALFEIYTDLPFGQHTILVEELLHGYQVTLEGYMFHGEVEVLGIVDSIMFPGTLAFERFDYPSRLSDSICLRMTQIATKLMQSSGFDNGIFNIEFMYNFGNDSVHIIEVNPRMASQFADLYEKVDGFNTYQIQIDLALGLRPKLTRNCGAYRMAASCVLRVFNDRLMEKVPSDDEIANLVWQYPQTKVEVLSTAGHWLSQGFQDGRSFRYGLVNLGADDSEEIQRKLVHCLRRLSFVMR